MKRIFKMGTILVIFGLGLFTVSNITLGDNMDSNSTVSFNESVTVKQKIAKFINDQKVASHTIQIKYLDKKGNKINPDKIIHLKKGSKYNLLNKH